MTKPYRFQEKAVKKARRLNGRMLMAHDMGLGKSFMSLLYADSNKQARPIVIVCPASLKWNWEREVLIHLGKRSTILEGTRPPTNKGALKGQEIIILNYDIAHKWLKHLKRIKPKLVILDECHYLKNPTTRRTRITMRLCHKVSHVLALSGTALVNEPAELWPIVNLLRPDLFSNKMEFLWTYTKPQKTFWGWKFKGAKNTKQLYRILKKEVMCRCTKESVLEELPPKQRNMVILGLDKSSQKEYQEAFKNFYAWLKKRDPKKARRARRAEFLVKAGYLKRLAAELKMRSVLEWIENFLEESDEKLIVFAHHKSVVGAIAGHFRPQAVVVTGEVVGRKRQAAWDQFLRNRKTRLLVGNLQAAGTGQSAKGVVNECFVELPWTPGELNQAADRTRGIGRGREGVKSTSWYLIAKDTIEMKHCELLQKKQGVLDSVLDGADEGTSSLDIFDQLEKELERQARKLFNYTNKRR